VAATVSACDPTGIAPDSEDFAFDTSCRDRSSLEACSSCCEGLGGDQVFVASGNCGCGVSERDTDVCDDAGSFSVCGTCCEGAGFGDTVSFSEGTNGQVCSCFRTRPLGQGRNSGNTGGAIGTQISSRDWLLSVMATSWDFRVIGVSRSLDSTLRRGSDRLDFTYEAQDATRFPGAPRSAAFVIATIEAPAPGTYDFAYKMSGDHGSADSTLELRFLVPRPSMSPTTRAFRGPSSEADG